MAGAQRLHPLWSAHNMAEPNASEELAVKLTEHARCVFAPTRVLLAYAYGSRVRGISRPESDLDVGYYLKDYRTGGCLSVRDEMALSDELSQRMGVEVDLRNLGSAPLEVRGRVLEDGIRVFCDDEVRRVHLESELLGRYHDYKETFRALHKGRLKSISESGI